MNQESNFSFLQQEFSSLFPTVRNAEEHVFTDPVYSAFLSRKSLEEFVKWLYDNDESLQIPSTDTTLNALMHEQSFKELIPQILWRDINLLRKIGNNAVHVTSVKVTEEESLVALKALHGFALWVVRLYSRSQTPVVLFDETILPTGTPVERTKKELEALAKQYQNTQQQLQRANEALASNQAALDSLKQRLAEVQAIKAENIQTVEVVTSLSESETRKIYIDALLKEAGWNLTLPNVIEFELQYVEDPDSSRFADYVLWGDDGKPLGVVETKKTTVDSYKGKRQAEIYADCLEKMFGQRPVIFFTNGFETNIWDDQFYPHRAVQGFYTKEELQLLINRRNMRQKLSDQPINKQIAGRYYQEEAIKRVAEDLEKRKRGALLVMATGSGKTRTAAAITDMLTKAGWAKRILFLADRNALVTQAKNAFNIHLPHITAIDLTKEDADTTSRLVFSTYPTIMNRIDSVITEGERYFGVGHVDVVIIDEAHRSVYQKYRDLFEYFDAIYIGLTATPKSEADKDTYELFGLEPHNPTYAYELDQAVLDEYLVPPKAIKVPLKFPRTGIKYDQLSEEEKAEYEKEFLENYGIVPNEVNSAAINEWLFNKDTVNKVLQLLMEKGLMLEGGDKLGKTIVFARNHEHAKFIETCFNELYPHYAGKFLQVIDNQVYDPQGLIDKFSNPAQTEFQIAVSVDMLDTGIDIPEVVNLVIFKPVRSKAKFWQMIGRGTRLAKNLFGPDMDKKFFHVFDVCGNLEFFSSDIKEIEPPIRGSLSQQVFSAKLTLAFLLESKAISDDDKKLKNDLLDELHGIIASLNSNDFRVRMRMRYVEKYRAREKWNCLQKTEVLEIEKYLSSLYTDDRSNESARRFDLLMLNYIISALEASPTQRNYKAQIQSTVKGLNRVMTIPSVHAKEVLINYIQEEEYWNQGSLFRHNQSRIELRNLIQYIPPVERKNLYTDFEDTLGTIEEVEILTQYQELGAYKKRVEEFIKKNRSHITINRIITNKPITQRELEELERLLFSIDTTADKGLLEKAISRQPLAKFIRSILGLDINAAKEAFSTFLVEEKFNADQLRFINTIIDYLAKNGTIDKSKLFDKPFTDINALGLSGLFRDDEVAKIVSIVDQINGNAQMVAG